MAVDELFPTVHSIVARSNSHIRANSTGFVGDRGMGVCASDHGFVWVRYLPRHDLLGQGVIAAVFLGSLWLSFLFFFRAKRALENELPTVPGHWWLSVRTLVVGNLCTLATGISLVWVWWAIVSADDRRDLEWLGYNVYVEVPGAQISSTNRLGTRGAARSAQLAGHDLRFAFAPDSVFAGANLSAANMTGAEFSEADLSGADLSRAILRDTNLRGANLARAILVDADLSAADLAGADLRNAVFWPRSESGRVEAADAAAACARLRKAKNWSITLRDPVLACGRVIPLE